MWFNGICSDLLRKLWRLENQWLEMQILRKATMNLLNSVKEIAGGADAIACWLGSGGHVVSFEEAQERANVCFACPLNVSVGKVKDAIAGTVKKTLEIKNKIGLRVQGEKALGQCKDCGCVLRLLVWEEQKRIEPFLSDQEKARLPKACWKLNKP